MARIKIKNNNGFALLYAVVVSSIILAIAISVSDIAFKGISFSTSAKDANDAFYAADTALECALYYDSSADTQNAYTGNPSSSVSCAGNVVIISKDSLINKWTFYVPNLGSSGKACAMITVDKETNAPNTQITSIGYNDGSTVPGNCIATQNSTQRVIELGY
jgi:hypothetical protein